VEAEVGTLIERPWPRATVVPAAFEQLFRAEYARVVRIAYRVVGDQGEAQDVAQDVFIGFYRAHPAGAPYAAPWLHRAAAHAALNAVRSRTRRTAREERDASGRDAVADPEDAALERERAGADSAFVFGNVPTFADCVLVPQMYNAERHGCDLSKFPRLHALAQRLRELPAFAAAHPSRQPDFPPASR